MWPGVVLYHKHQSPPCVACRQRLGALQPACARGALHWCGVGKDYGKGAAGVAASSTTSGGGPASVTHTPVRVCMV